MNKIKGVVYLLKSPSGKEYVGRTIDLKRRLRRFKNEKKQKSPVYLEVQKYGFENFEVEVLFECEGEKIEVESTLNEMEKLFISEKGMDNLLNVYRWDSDLRDRGMPESARDKIRNAHIGRQHSEESRLKRSGEHAYQGKRVRSDKLGKTFNTLKEAANYAGIGGGCKISECIKGMRKHTGRHPVTNEPIGDWKFVQ